MQSLLQLNPPIPMQTPKGEGLAILVLDYGPDFDFWWTVMITKGEHAGEIWTYRNPDVRGVDNITLSRHPKSPTIADNKTKPHRIPKSKLRPNTKLHSNGNNRLHHATR